MYKRQPGVTILEGATSGAVIENGRLRFPLGAVSAGQQREILFRARVNTARLGARQLATARLVYETPDERARREQSVQLAYEVTRDEARAVAPRVAAMVADHEAVAAQRRAAALMQQGQAQQAAVVLRQAEASVQQQAQAAPPAARARMQERAGSLGRASSAAGAATSAPEMRQRSYDFADEAMSAEGY